MPLQLKRRSKERDCKKKRVPGGEGVGEKKRRVPWWKVTGPVPLKRQDPFKTPNRYVGGNHHDPTKSSKTGAGKCLVIWGEKKKNACFRKTPLREER